MFCCTCVLGMVIAARLSCERVLAWVLRINHQENRDGNRPMARTKSVFNTFFTSLISSLIVLSMTKKWDALRLTLKKGYGTKNLLMQRSKKICFEIRTADCKLQQFSHEWTTIGGRGAMPQRPYNVMAVSEVQYFCLKARHKAFGAGAGRS